MSGVPHPQRLTAHEETTREYQDASAGDLETESDSTIDSARNTASDTSSVEYCHEPFETFKTRVLELCTSHWPGSTPEHFDVKRMQGGSYNQVIGVSFTGPQHATIEDFVLRVPRDWPFLLKYDLSTMIYAATATTLPVPETIAFDLTDHNALGKAYSIQKRIAGDRLEDVYPRFTHAQKLSVAKAMGRSLRDLQCKRIDCAGKISPTYLVRGKKDRVDLIDIHVRNRFSDDEPDDIPVATDRSVAEVTIGGLERWKQFDLASSPPEETWLADPWDALIDVAREMDSCRLFDGQRMVFCHLDLQPRNILVTVASVTEIKIEGILDWDSALFAPHFVGCRAPFWLWRWEDEDNERDERNALKPMSTENEDIKQAFEDIVGEDYLALAYPRWYALARSLFVPVLEGMFSNEEMRAAEAIVNEWKALSESFRNAVTTQPKVHSSWAAGVRKATASYAKGCKMM